MKKGFSELFKESLKEYKEKFIPILKTFVFLYLIPLIVLITISITATIIYLENAFITNKNNPAQISQLILENISPGNLFLLASITILFVLIFIYFNIISTLTYLYLGFSKKPNFKVSFAKARKDFWKYLGFILVISIFLSILFLLLIIPGVIFLVYWIFAVFILIDERKGIIESLKESFNMIKGRWWLTFGYILLISLILGTLSSILSFFPFGSLISHLILTPFMIFFIKNYYLEVRKNKK